VEDPGSWTEGMVAGRWTANNAIDGNPNTAWHTAPVNGMENTWYFVVFFLFFFKNK
jgi:hypothetical protein